MASDASSSSAQAPLRLPMAFHVQIVFSLRAAICMTGTVISPWGEATLAQSPSAKLFASQILVGT